MGIIVTGDADRRRCSLFFIAPCHISSPNTAPEPKHVRFLPLASIMSHPRYRLLPKHPAKNSESYFLSRWLREQLYCSVCSTLLTEETPSWSVNTSILPSFVSTSALGRGRECISRLHGSPINHPPNVPPPNDEAIGIHTGQTSRTRALTRIHQGVTDTISYFQGTLERVLGAMVRDVCLLDVDDVRAVSAVSCVSGRGSRFR